LNIIQITPGTGNFYCGSCLRDAALVVELRRRGHDVLCVPLYLPFVVEENDLTDVPIFFGGINVFLQQHSSIFRHTPRWIDRWLDRPALLGLASRGDHLTSARELGELTLSMLHGEEGRQVKEVRRLTDWLRELPRADVICLSNALLMGIGATLKRTLSVPVVCTLQGEDTFLDDLPEPLSGQAWDVLCEKARSIDLFIPVSDYYRDVMGSRLGVPRDRTVPVHNGIDFDTFSPRTVWPDPPVLGFFARMCPAKGLHTLVDAYIRIRTESALPSLRLHIGGAQTASDEGYVREQNQKLCAAGLDGDVVWRPNLEREEKVDFLRGLTLLSVPATYGESFGLYVLEALACEVPVVQPDHAAFKELISGTGGGLLVPPDDVDALAAAVVALAGDRERNQAMGRAGSARAREKYSLEAMADGVLQALASCLEFPPGT